MRFDENKLKKKLEVDEIVAVDLNSSADVDNNDSVTIFHHPRGGKLKSSICYCNIVSKFFIHKELNIIILNLVSKGH